jgi:DNA-nicking Smr family endonuclease
MAKHNDTRTIDIHGLTATEAKERVGKRNFLCSSFYKKIIVIHGYNKGNILQKTVRTQIRSNAYSKSTLALQTMEKQLFF